MLPIPKMSIRTVDDLGPICQDHSGQVKQHIGLLNAKTGLGQHCIPMVPCEAHSLLVQVVPAVFIPISNKSNNGSFSPQGQISLRYTLDYHILLHYSPSALGFLSKDNATNGLSFSQGRTSHTAFPSHLPICTMAT